MDLDASGQTTEPARTRWLRVPGILRLLWAAIRAWYDDGVSRLGASLAYYTLFALAPMLLIAIAVAGAVFGQEAAQGQIVGEIDQLIGTDGAQAVQSLLAGANKARTGSVLATVIGGLAILISATGAFLELQTSLNSIWRVQPKPGVRIKTYFKNRARSFALVLGIGFLLLVSLVVSAALAALGKWLSSSSAMPVLWDVVNLGVSLTVITTLFMLLYRFLPDVKLRWRDVAVGALVTAVLFTIGKELIGLYIGHSTTASSYGAAGSVIVLLLWVYYSSQIVLLGAEFTRVYARQTGAKPKPEAFAEKEPAGAKKAPGDPRGSRPP
jgi:membrane protein